MFIKYIYSLLILIGICVGKSVMAFPTLTGPVVDTANVLSTSVEQQLISLLQTEQTHQIVVVTVDSLNGQAIEEYGYQLGRHWEIGEKGKDNGVLLILAPNDGLARIEVGYGLEGVLTDAVSATIINHHMMPLLKEKQYEQAAIVGAKDILATIKGETFATPAVEEEVGFGAIVLTLLIVGLFIYVASAPREDRARRLRLVLFFLSFVPGKGGFRGKGGRFGGGGSTGRFK